MTLLKVIANESLAENAKLKAEIERLRAAGQKLLSELWEDEYGNFYCASARAYKEAVAVFNEQLAGDFPVSIAKMRQPEERAKNAELKAQMDAVYKKGLRGD